MTPNSSTANADGSARSSRKNASPWWEVTSVMIWSFAVGVSTLPLIELLRKPKRDYEWIYFLLMILAYLALAIVSALRIVRKEKKDNMAISGTR